MFFFHTNRVKVINLSIFIAQKKSRDPIGLIFGQQGRDKWVSHMKPKRATEAKLIMLCYHKVRRCIGARKMLNLVT